MPSILSARKLATLSLAVLASVAVSGLVASAPARAAALEQVTSFGTNPSNLDMYVYRPDGLPAHPPLVVAVHWCTGSASAMYSGTQFAALADQHKFIVIYPSSTHSDKCFDVSSPAALTRNGGSDPVGIRSMVTYAEQNYGVDADRIYATGVSSGAMMTNVLLADYPDVFKAGVAFAGVPYTCFATGSTTNRWNSECSTGQTTKTAQAWGDLVRANNPGYSGPWPRMQLWHGTADETLNYNNFGEQIKQWTNVNGLTQTPTRTDSPATGQTRTQYADSGGTVLVEGHSLAGVTHNLPISAAAAIAFFGLDAGSSPTPTATPTPTLSATPTPTPSATTPAPGAAACSATFAVSSSWNSGFVGSVTVKATGSAITGWKVSLSLPSGTTVTNVWNGVQNGSAIANAAWNGTLGAGGSTDFGFQGSGSATGISVTACTAT